MRTRTLDARAELESFKRDVNLSEYMAAQDYRRDPKESSRNSIVMRREADNDKLIVSRDSDGHWMYFSVRDESDSGTIIDFHQRRTGHSMGQTRRALRPWINKAPDLTGALPEVRIREPEPKTSDPEALQARLEQLSPINDHPYLQERGIPRSILGSTRFAGTVHQDERGNAVFLHQDPSGVTGFEIKNRDFTGFSLGGHKRVWLSKTFKHDQRLVITESAIDALSHARLHRLEAETSRYLSVSGSMSVEQGEVVRLAMVKMHERGGSIVLATDRDEAGEKLATHLKELAPAGANVTRQTPTVGKDWNEQLQAKLARSRSQEVSR